MVIERNFRSGSNVILILKELVIKKFTDKMLLVIHHLLVTLSSMGSHSTVVLKSCKIVNLYCSSKMT